MKATDIPVIKLNTEYYLPEYGEDDEKFCTFIAPADLIGGGWMDNEPASVKRHKLTVIPDAEKQSTGQGYY